MPNNRWITPYKLSPSACLSFGPSQGMVYQLSKTLVVKLPFQYPLNSAPSQDEKNEQLYMSLRSFALFKKEIKFYNVLSAKPHPNLARRLPTNQIRGIVLEHFQRLEEAWNNYSKKVHSVWVQELLSGLEWLEQLGYTHGDLKVHNIGVDGDGRLRLFDFGSVVNHKDEGFDDQVVEDCFNLATCVHFLASGIDPVAKASSLAEVREILRTLKEGKAVVDEAAREYENIIQAGWTGMLLQAWSFSSLRSFAATIAKIPPTDCILQPEIPLSCTPSAFTDLLEEPRWMDEADYRAAWKAEGYELIEDIWN